MTISDTIALEIVHGTPHGYELGCKSNGGCKNHGSRSLMTCSEAAHAARSDWALHDRPQDKPWRKNSRRLQKAPRQPRTAWTHGTVWGYAQGCTTETGCPNYGVEGQETCTAANTAYRQRYSNDRLNGKGKGVKHGTTSGYTLGCHDRSTCPGNADGLTCSDAANIADEQRRRRNGIQPREPLTDSGPARRHLLQMRAAGMSLNKIVAATGVHKNAIRILLNGRMDYANGQRGPRYGEIPARISLEKSDRILNTPISQPKASSPMHDIIIDLANTAATQAARAAQLNELTTRDAMEDLNLQLLAAAGDIQTGPAQDSIFELLDHGRQLIAHTMVRLDSFTMAGAR